MVLFHSQKNWGCLPFKKWCHIPLSKHWGHLTFSKKLRSSSILKKMRLSSIFIKLRSSSFFQKNWGRLPFSKKLRSSSIFKNIEVGFHNSSSWVKIRLHTKKQLPRLPRAKLRSSSIYKKNVGRLLFSNVLRLSSIFHLVGLK